MAGENGEGEGDGSLEVEVEVDDEAGGGAGGEGGKANGAAAPAAGASASPTVDDAVAKLQADLAAAERRATAAEHDARSARAAAGQAGDEVRQGHLNIVNAGIENLKSQKLQLRQMYAAAAAEGDHDKMADIQDQMTEASTKLLALENGKLNLETAPAPRPQPTGDLVEDMARSLTPESGAWVRAHPEYARDQRKTVAMIAAHNLAISAHDLKPDTPEYFAFVERTLGIGHSDAAPVRTTPAPAPAARTTTTPEPLSAAAKPATQPSPAAPSRSGAGAQRMKLTPQQVEAAKISGITPQEYAKNLLEERKKGNVH